MTLGASVIECPPNRRRDLAAGDDFPGRYGIVGRSAAMQRIFEQITESARCWAKILLLGESGVGTGLIARAIHQNAPRASGPFVTINCAAIPRDLLEIELFGHEKGRINSDGELRARQIRGGG